MGSVDPSLFRSGRTRSPNPQKVVDAPSLRLCLRQHAHHDFVPVTTTIRKPLGLPRDRRPRHSSMSACITLITQPKYTNTVIELHLLRSISSTGRSWRRRIIIQFVLCRWEISQRAQHDSCSGASNPNPAKQIRSVPGQPCALRASLLSGRDDTHVQPPHESLQLRHLLCQTRGQHHRPGGCPQGSRRCSRRPVAQTRRRDPARSDQRD